MADPLLAIEEHHALWEPEVYGLKLWPLIRFFLLTEVDYKDRGYLPSAKEGRKVYLLPSRWSRYLRTVSFLFSHRRKDFSSLFIVPHIYRYPLEDQDHTVDRLYNDFYNLVGNPLILESSPTSLWAKPDKRYQANIYSEDILWLWAFAQSQSWHLSTRIHNYIYEFADFISTLYDAKTLRDQLAIYMSSFVKQYFAIRPLIARYVAPKLRNRFALIESACYLGRTSLVTKTLHDLGFHVTEAQHGLINEIHYAYNIPSSYIEDPKHPSHLFFPDSLLTFGEYWSQVSHIPGIKVVVGYPYLSRIVEHSGRDIPVHPGQILVLSGYTIRNKAISLARELALSFRERTIVFKLHPMEIHMEKECAPLRDLANIRIVGHSDVYRLVAESEIIVGYASTVLLEAVAFSGKRIFFNEPDFVPDEVGEHFSTAVDLVEMIRDPNRGFPGGNSYYFWADQWQTRLTQFLRSHIVN